ncbi:MAG: hypothetical protein ACLR7U_05450 [Ruthenibacterium lactatiformans]
MDEKLLLEQIDAFVAENRENVLRDLKTLVDINSVEGQQPGAPSARRKPRCAGHRRRHGSDTQLQEHIGYADLPTQAPRHHYASGRGARGQQLDRLPV